jgi:Na+/H+-dicarboxylate symporter
MEDTHQGKPWYRRLYVQVLLAVGLGILFGSLFPEQGKALKPLGDGFIRLIKMLVAPIVFITVAQGIAGSGQRKGFGRLGVKTFLYFEVVSTLALMVGLLMVNWLKPGVGFHVDPASLDPAVGAAFAEKAKGGQGFVDFLLGLIPNSFIGALACGGFDGICCFFDGRTKRGGFAGDGHCGRDFFPSDGDGCAFGAIGCVWCDGVHGWEFWVGIVE